LSEVCIFLLIVEICYLISQLSSVNGFQSDDEDHRDRRQVAVEEVKEHRVVFALAFASLVTKMVAVKLVLPQLIEPQSVEKQSIKRQSRQTTIRRML
jgi:hypothetical protein